MSRPGAPEEAELRRWVLELREGTAVEENSRRIFDHYYEWVRGFFRRRGFSTEETEDLAQEAFLQVFHRISTYREESAFSSWLFAVAANVARNHRRTRGTRKRTGQEVPLEPENREEANPGLELVDGNDLPDQEFLEKEYRERLGRTVDGLPDQMRRCFLLRYDRGLKYREIAALLKLSLETVKVHLFNARKRLQKELGEDLGDSA